MTWSISATPPPTAVELTFQIVRPLSRSLSRLPTMTSRSYRSWPMTGASLDSGSRRSATSCSSVTYLSLAIRARCAPSAPRAQVPGAVTKSISSSTRPRNAGSRSVKLVTERRIRCQAAAGSAGQPMARSTPSFHGAPRGTSGQPEHGRLDRGPDVDERMPDDEHVRRAHPRRDPALLRAVDQVIDQDTELATRLRGELGHDRGQVVDAAEVLDHDADVAQVVAPDLLDELGVVPALHVDPARPGDPRPARRRGDRPRRRPRPAGGSLPRRSRPDQCDRLALKEERPGPERKRPPLAVPVLQQDGVLLPADHGAAVLPGRVLDDHPAGGRDPRVLRLRAWPAGRGQHVAVVPLAPHRRASPPGSAVDHGRVVAEVHRDRVRGPDPLQRPGPGSPVTRLPGRQLGVGGAAVLRRGV